MLNQIQHRHIHRLAFDTYSDPSLRAAFRGGYRAASEGVALRDCPYKQQRADYCPPVTFSWKFTEAWRRGWRAWEEV